MITVERERRILYCKNQFEIAKMHATYWQAMAVTNVGPIADEALKTMLRHIQFMSETNETIADLMTEGIVHSLGGSER